MSTRKKECVITLKTGDHKWTLKAFQSPRGLRHEGKRPDIVAIDCYQECNQQELFRFAEYLQIIACSMGVKSL